MALTLQGQRPANLLGAGRAFAADKRATFAARAPDRLAEDNR
jgi:hypothetical protein